MSITNSRLVDEPKLTIELVPAPSWAQNLRTLLKAADWKKLAQAAYKKANYRCEICGKKGNKHPVEAHEIWLYDDENHIQEFDSIIALCPWCHQVKHIGFTSTRGTIALSGAIAHLCKVNSWSLAVAKKYIVDSVALWQERSKYEWAINITKPVERKPTVSIVG